MTATLRCAIYTRVSSDAGLEQDFNSLDAQRESAEAYIKSQAHEGWRLVRERFDDGGYSGGSTDRPALQRLLDRIGERRVDVVVVILDNLGSHKGKAVRKAIRDVGARLVFLPKYSPDLNPIEQVFAKFKTLLRKVGARSYEAICQACDEILAQYPPAECAPYLKNAGYA